MSNQQITEIEQTGPVTVGDGTPWEYYREYAWVMKSLSGLDNVKQGFAHQNATAIANEGQADYKQSVGTGMSIPDALTHARSIMDQRVAAVRSQYGLGDAPGVAASGLLPGQNPGDVNSGDVKDATQVYRDSVNSGKDVYGRILGKTGEPDPSAIKFFEANRVKPGTVSASQIDSLGNPLVGVKQEATTVQGADVADLQATARGEGAGQLAAKARMDQLLLRQGQQASGQIQQARGHERAGLRLQQLVQQGEQTVNAGKALAEVDAATSLQAQQQVAQLDEKKKSLQATLDAARASGDAERIQRAEKDMADFEQDTKKFNADKVQDASKFNVDQDAGAQGTNLTAGMQSIKQDFETWKQTNELALEAQKALEASAQGLLNEDQRQQTLVMARRQLENAEKEFAEMQRRNARAEELQAQQQKISFWGTLLTTLVARVIPQAVPAPAAPAPAPAKAEHGGAVDRATQLLVGEAGDHELVIPIKGKLSDRMLNLLSVDSQPFNAAGPKGEIDSMPDLMNAIRSTLKTAPDDDMTSMMAAATLRRR